MTSDQLTKILTDSAEIRRDRSNKEVNDLAYFEARKKRILEGKI